MDRAQSSDSNTTETYEIRIQGHLHPRRAELFEGLRVTLEPDGTTTLCGPLPDQTALHSILLRIRDMNLKLLSVHQIGGNAEVDPGHRPMETEAQGYEPSTAGGKGQVTEEELQETGDTYLSREQLPKPGSSGTQSSDPDRDNV